MSGFPSQPLLSNEVVCFALLGQIPWKDLFDALRYLGGPSLIPPVGNIACAGDGGRVGIG